jgi:hypothetical protein
MRHLLGALALGVVACGAGPNPADHSTHASSGDSGGSNSSGGSGPSNGGSTGGNGVGASTTGGDTSGGGNSSSAGSAGTQNGGSGGSNMPVQPCDNLPAPGAWENVTPPGSHAPAVNGTVGAAVIVDPFDPRTVWLGTGGENDEIWRSDDCGATWTQVNTGPGGVGDGATYGGVGDGAQWSMQADPVDPGVLYATSGYGAQSLWKTTDGGTSWTDVLAGSEYADVADYDFVNNVSLDPEDHLHVVVSTHGSCQAPYGPSCIAETTDGGDSWRVLKAPEGWVEGGGLVLVKGGLWLWCGTNLLVTTDSGATWQDDALAGGGNCEAEYTIRPFVPASNGNYYIGSRGGVLRSADGMSWEHVANTSGFMVMVTQGSERIFAANQWQPSIRWASLDADENWSDLVVPQQQIDDGGSGGIPFLAYDDAHGILYASMFPGGVARMVIE